MRIIAVISAAIIVALSGCRVGTGGADLPVAKQPGGAQVSFRVSSGVYTGELLAMQDDGVVIGNDRVLFAPYTAIESFAVEKMGRDFQLGRADTPTGGRLERFRAVSRFPQGLAPNIRAQVLAQRSQTEIVVVR